MTSCQMSEGASVDDLQRRIYTDRGLTPPVSRVRRYVVDRLQVCVP